MNFALADEQVTIKQTARELLAARYGSGVIRAFVDGDGGHDPQRWRAVGELGWPGIVVPEAWGGLGFGALELAVLAEELGYALAPTPLLPSVWAGLLIAAAGGDDQRRRWLPALASGELRGTVARWNADGTGPAAPPDGARGRRWTAVPEAAAADLLVLVRPGGGYAVVEATAPCVAIVPQAPLDPTRPLAAVEIDGLDPEPLDGGDDAAIARAEAVILTSLAAESVGVAQRATEQAVEYAGVRHQFGRPIGAYQAIAHRCAQMLLETEGARSLTYGAAYAVDREPGDASRAASMAKAYAGDAGFRVPASALQVLGGIGFTWEHDLHFLLKRGTANAHALGTAAEHRERIASAALDGP